ncbi:hypothetical protein HMPREF1051_1389 [Neisseria sicca VK64]|uniref:Uncharacterized protein n=1 Tax=Neisseria sicca VK64 TaxID=1095748 RepID=I2NNK7_NEISI|nr:hypothetical protein HMPREF1051_1389 [Neisseria sicca VK64]
MWNPLSGSNGIVRYYKNKRLMKKAVEYRKSVQRSSEKVSDDPFCSD